MKGPAGEPAEGADEQTARMSSWKLNERWRGEKSQLLWRDRRDRRGKDEEPMMKREVRG